MEDVELDGGMSKTLHSGLRVLELLSAHPDGLTVTEIADGIGVHRTVAHRFVRTLEAHRLVRRDRAKRIRPGAGLVPLAEPVERDLRAVATPLLEELADECGATAHLVSQEDDDHVRALLVVEPRRASVHIAFRPGQLDRIDRGSAGMAILAARPARADERTEVGEARTRGYAVSYGEVIPSIYGISCAVPGRRDSAPISVGVSLFDLADEQRLAGLVGDCADRLARALG
ncbi:IclR family transcriptional regulator [Nocardioides mangrovi]|uniref:Helix-turn-helix domain-containing protein n=1 Tax=Nocardioides mangrovi TaxID=2874580 RepID=A0ABS7UHJ1_9ACTN|nr:helix-turn-helix domain-containing protein [Nocardioides mangrovi]MBZ5740494.1 helix-turn-helix domain-containing protein [Nocardioides mangrovi]